MDQSVHKELPALFALAHDHSDAGRIKFVEKLTEVFLAPNAALTSHETKLVDELIKELLKNGGQATRQALIQQFARAVEAPRELAMRVSVAPIELARPVLAANENLTDNDLIEIVEKQSTDHAAAIATRKQINEAVADALVTTGDVRIMHIVAENLGAKLSPRALSALVDSARLTSFLQEPILARPELTPENAIRLYWWISREMRRETLARYGFGPNKLEISLGKATEEILASLLLKKEDDTAMYSLANWLQERGALTTQLLPQLLRMGHYRLFNITLSRLSQLELPLIDIINTSAGGRMMVVLCRAIGIEKGNFVSIFLMARGARKDEQIVHPRELSMALEAYDKLEPEMAKAMVECWRLDPTSIRQRSNEPTSIAATG